MESTEFENTDQFWDAVRQSIQDRLGHRRYSLWFHQTELSEVREGTLVVGVPNLVVQQYLTGKYSSAVVEAVEELAGESVEVKFDVAPRLFRESRARREEQQRESEREGARGVDFARATREVTVPAEWGFDRLIITAANQFPCAAARELAGQENPRFRFLYVCGDYGLGKTALLRAVYALAAGPERHLDPVFTSAEDWCNEYYQAIQRRSTRQFRSRYRSRRMLLLDDLQFVQGKEGGQRELMHTIKHILAEGGRVALASRPHPEELRDLIPGLQALLRRAFHAVLVQPDEGERCQIARQMAAKHGLRAAPPVFRHLATRRGESFATIESAVNCLALYGAMRGNGRLELPEALEALAATRPTSAQPVRLGEVKGAVAELFDLETAELEGRSRRRTLVLARQMGMYLARKLTKASLSEIGTAFGRSSHSTVRHALDKIEDAREEDPQVAGLLRRLREKLRGA